MAACPKCATVLKDDYGMVTCAHCRTIVFIDMDGLAHFGAESPISETPAIESLNEDLNPGEAGVPVGSTEQEPSLDWQNVQADAPVTQLEDKPQEEPEFTMDHVPGYQAESEPVSYGEDGQVDQVEAEPAHIGTPGDPLGLNAYANSELSQGKDGLLVFRVVISGIDSKEIRESLREAIEDSRFAWDSQAVLARIQKGVLQIENLSPVKATILINRIKRFPVHIFWEQYAITQMDGHGKRS